MSSKIEKRKEKPESAHKSLPPSAVDVQMKNINNPKPSSVDERIRLIQLENQRVLNAVKSLKRLKNVYGTLNKLVVGREQRHHALMLALLSREHVVFIGPPGIGKSYSARLLSRLVNARFYKYLLTKFTDFSELFGPLDIKAYLEGEYKRRWSKITESDIVFLDEIFKANSAILNSLLSLLEERVVYEGTTGEEKKTALWTLVAASNEVPDEPELMALYDRFALKVFEEPLTDSISRKQMLAAKWSSEAPVVKPIASMEDIKNVSDLAEKILLGKQGGKKVIDIFHEKMEPLVSRLIEEGVYVSERTFVEKLPKIFAAYLVFHGLYIESDKINIGGRTIKVLYPAIDQEVMERAPFEIAPFLAQEKSQLKIIKNVIDDILGEIADLKKALEMAQEHAAKGNFQGALNIIANQILTYDIGKFADKPWIKEYATMIINSAKELKQTIEEAMEMTQRSIARRSRRGFYY